MKITLDRSWCDGCNWCTGHCTDVTGDPFCDYRFCPICGRPLTEEAWAELERSINDGKLDGWTNIKLNLPKDGEEVITYSEKRKKISVCSCLKSYVELYGNYDLVTHWMPPPKPPEE